MDLNNDGLRDLLSGSYSRMERPMAGLFQVLWRRADGEFKTAAVLTGTDQAPLIIPIKDQEEQAENICTRPTAVDWNADGKLDLIVGNFAGSFYLFVGEGGGRFAPKPEPLMAGKDRLKIQGAHSDPFVVDWDSDGDLDLFSGASQGGVQWAENTAGPGKTPVLSAFQTLIKPGPAIETGQLLAEHEQDGPLGSSRVWIDDVNGDGKLDILVGDNVTLTSPAKGLTKKQYEQKLKQWNEALEAAHQAMRKADEARDPKPATLLGKTPEEVYRERTQFMIEDRTGFVWLYRGR